MMCNIIVVTNRKLCSRDFAEQIDIICRRHPLRIILREKDLSFSEYEKLYTEINAICLYHGVELFANYFRIPDACGIQLPFDDFTNHGRGNYTTVGVSVHAVSEAITAQSLGADYLIAGHIFATDCKRGVPPRGLDFLREICSAVSIPVYAIGGMSENNFPEAESCGAAGFCMMSGAMRWEGR